MERPKIIFSKSFLSFATAKIIKKIIPGSKKNARHFPNAENKFGPPRLALVEADETKIEIMEAMKKRKRGYFIIFRRVFRRLRLPRRSTPRNDRNQPRNALQIMNSKIVDGNPKIVKRKLYAGRSAAAENKAKIGRFAAIIKKIINVATAKIIMPLL